MTSLHWFLYSSQLTFFVDRLITADDGRVFVWRAGGADVVRTFHEIVLPSVTADVGDANLCLHWAELTAGQMCAKVIAKHPTYNHCIVLVQSIVADEGPRVTLIHHDRPHGCIVAQVQLYWRLKQEEQRLGWSSHVQENIIYSTQ